jgi:hypothetical protein
MFSNEVIPMAVKKSTSSKSSTKTATKAKAAPKKAAPTKAAPKAKADTKTKAPKAGGAKKAAVKKAPAVKLTDPQRKLLGDVAATKEAGIMGAKGNAKMLGALLEKKLIKKGKKEGEYFRYHITKAGEKHSSSSGSSTAPAESSSSTSSSS